MPSIFNVFIGSINLENEKNQYTKTNALLQKNKDLILPRVLVQYKIQRFIKSHYIILIQHIGLEFQAKINM